MTDFQVYVLSGAPENVTDREEVLVDGMQAVGYIRQTRFRLPSGASLSFLSGESVDTGGEDWDPPLKAGDTCVVLVFKKE